MHTRQQQTRSTEQGAGTVVPPLDAGWYPKVNKDPRPVMMAVRLALVVGTAHGAMDGVCRVVGASAVHETERWGAAGPVRAAPNQLADPASISFHTRWHAGQLFVW